MFKKDRNALNTQGFGRAYCVRASREERLLVLEARNSWALAAIWLVVFSLQIRPSVWRIQGHISHMSHIADWRVNEARSVIDR